MPFRVRAAGWLAAAAVASTPILIVARLGLENRYQADDYSTAARFTYLGFLGSVVDQLRVLNGRFAGYFVTDVLTLFGPHGAWIATWSVLGVLLATVTLAVPASAGGWPARVAVGVMATSAFILAVPAPEQALLWIAGAGMVTVSVAFAAGSVAAARLATGMVARQRQLALGAAFVLALLASGSYETTAVVLVACSGVAVVAVGRRSPALVPTVAVAGGALVGLVIVALLPGSSSRKTDLTNGMPFRDSVRLAWTQALEFVEPLLRAKPLWVILGVGLAVSAPRVRWVTSLRWGVLGVIAGLGGLQAVFALSNWSLGTLPPARTMTVAWALAVAVVFLLGWLVPVPRPLAAPVVLVVLGLILHLSLPRLDQIPARAAWASDWDRRDARLRSASSDEVVRVVPLDSGAGLEDLSSDRTSWVNGAAAIYYDVEAIEATPDAPLEAEP